MIDAALAETPARRQAGVAGADDDRRDLFDDPLRFDTRSAWAYLTSTLTFVGLVMMS